MPKRDIETRIAELKARRDRANAEIDSLRRRASAEARKRDMRRKIVAGGAVLGAAAKSPKVDAWLRGLLDRTVARETDRALFDLGAGPGEAPGTAPKADADRIIDLLAGTGRALREREIARELGIDLAAASRECQRLEERGRIARMARGRAAGNPVCELLPPATG